MSLSNIFNILNLVLNLLDKLAFILACFFFGNISFKGWKGRSSVLFKWLSVIVLGIICFFGGLTIKEFFNWNFFASDYISSIIIAVILYLIIRLISTGFKVESKYATKESIHALTQDVKKLKIQVAKLTKALNDKQVVPKPLTEDEIRKSLKKELGKNTKIKKLEKGEDVWHCVVKTSKGVKKVLIDAYTGSIAGTKPIQSPLTFLFKNPLSTLGFILLLTFLIFLGSNTSLKTINAFNQAFDISFLFEEPLPQGCYEVSVLLENFAENEVELNPNITLLNNSINEELNNYYFLTTLTRSMNYEDTNYHIITLYSEKVNSLSNEITINEWSNIYNVRVCSFKSDYTLCNCIGGSKTDPVFTVPYLIELGLIEEAIQNVILNSLTGLLPV